MEYVQERIATLHDFADPTPSAPLSRTAVVVPMTEREHAGVAAERVFGTLADHDPARVVVPLRASPDDVGAVSDWLSGLDLSLTLLWCNGPTVEGLLDDHGLNGDAGKGRDVWLALGVAAKSGDYVAVHDADATSYGPAHVPRLVAPLTGEFSFVKGYYARVENDRLYGRLYRLFVAPLLQALGDAHEAPVLDYLSAFRYPLAGEFGATADLARSLSVPRHWGLEIATLGDAFDHGGFAGTAQVDLGRHEHDHRSVGGPSGLADMSRQVGSALFRAVEDHGVAPEYETLPERYRAAGRRLVDQYAADAAFNGFEYDRGDELAQVDTYAAAVEPPAGDAELPAWRDAPMGPEDVVAASNESLAER